MIALRTLVLLCCFAWGAWLVAADATPAVEPTPAAAPAATDIPKTAPNPAATGKRIAYVKIDGVIDPGKVAYYRRALDAAVTAKVDAVVVHLTTPGGRVDSAEEMTKAALAMPEDGPLTVAFVDRESYSAGSLIAYAHRRVYVTEVATLGNIGVIMQTAKGKIEYGPEKIETVIRTLLRSVAQKNGWDEAKLQKMTARNQDLYRFDLKDGPVWVIEDDLPRFLAAHPDVKTEQKVLILGEDRLLSYTAKEALADKMASGQVKDLDDLYRTLGGSSATVVDLKPSSSEELSWTLSGFAPLLAALAVLFVIMELKTPGIGIWATLAGICGLLFFICQFYLELASYPEVILVVLGLVALGLEIFLVPTGGLLALGGALLGLIGLVLAFMPDASQFAPNTPGWGNNLLEALISSALAMVVASGGLIALILALPRLAIARKMASTAEITATASGDPAAATAVTNLAGVGSRAIARSDLAPNGYIILDGRELSAEAQNGEFIKAGTQVEIIGMRFGEALVRPVTDSKAPNP
jgi:membrane-bound serine protease (ClpP class)